MAQGGVGAVEIVVVEVERSDTSGERVEEARTPEGCWKKACQHGSGTPPGCEHFLNVDRGYHLRSTPGYLLASLRDARLRSPLARPFH